MARAPSRARATPKIIADFVISKTALHQAYVENIDKLHEQVKDLTGVKDLGELNEKAQAKKDADEYVGNKAGVTNPTREPKLRDSHKWKQHGRKPVPHGTKKRARVKTGIKDTLS